MEKAIDRVKDQSTKSDIVSEAWIALQQFEQPTASELSDLFIELCACCEGILLVDLIKLSYQYLCGNPQRVFVGMQCCAS